MKDFFDFLLEDSQLNDLRSKLSDLGVNHHVSHNTVGDVVVSKLVVDKEKRNSGIGTKAMQHIKDYADTNGKRVVLTPSSDFGGSKPRLVKFYKKHGFYENKGKNRDFTTKETMIREPNT